MKQQILIATKNKGKLVEIREEMTELGIEVLGLEDILRFAQMTDVEEPAETFEGNAIIIAMTYGYRAGILTLAEDAGLEVDALNGRPGVLSARYVENEIDRCPRLLAEMKDVPDDRRGAQFTAVMAIFNPETKKIRTCQGTYRGIIIRELRGKNGFGFDPVFYNEELEKTNAEMTTKEKNSVSHRGKALKLAIEIIRKEFIQERR